MGTLEWGPPHCAEPPRLAREGARGSMASRRARGVGQQVRQCALRARSDCDEGRACCNVQNAPFLPRVGPREPHAAVRTMRALLSEQGAGVALRIAPCRRSSVR